MMQVNGEYCKKIHIKTEDDEPIATITSDGEVSIEYGYAVEWEPVKDDREPLPRGVVDWDTMAERKIEL